MRGKRVRLGEALGELLDRKGQSGPGPAASARVDSIWDQVVGEEIASHTRGIGFDGKTLRVSVDTHAWAAQLTYMGRELRERLNSELGQELVGEIRFTVSRAVEQERLRAKNEEGSRRRYGGPEVEPVRLTPKEMKALEDEAAEIKSDRLREAAIRARVRESEWKKGIEAAKGRERPSGDA